MPFPDIPTVIIIDCLDVKVSCAGSEHVEDGKTSRDFRVSRGYLGNLGANNRSFIVVSKEFNES